MVTGTVNAVYIFVTDWAIDLALEIREKFVTDWSIDLALTQSKTNLSRIFSALFLFVSDLSMLIITKLSI